MDRIRIVVAQAGLDDHHRGAEVLARALRDAGMEVVYTGPCQTPEQVVGTVLQEDADAIGISGAHLALFGTVIDLLRAKGAEGVVVFGGGVVPDDDHSELAEIGVARVFAPGTPTAQLVEWVRENVQPS